MFALVLAKIYKLFKDYFCISEHFVVFKASKKAANNI